ncbi:MAG: hypothetical protein U0232_30750 [Thermomicrobiales bacterium]
MRPTFLRVPATRRFARLGVARTPAGPAAAAAARPSRWPRRPVW